MKPDHPPGPTDGFAQLQAHRSLLDALPVGIVLFRPHADALPRIANRMARETLGDLVNLPLVRWAASRRLVREDGRTLTDEEIPPLATLRDHLPRREQFILLTRPGRTPVPLLVASEALKDAQGRVHEVSCTVVSLDAHHRREEQASLRTRLDALGMLADALAGPLNDALTAVTASTERALEAARETGTDGTALERVRDGVARATLLTRRLLAHGGRGIFEPRALSLGAWLMDRVNRFERMLGDHVRVIAIPPAEEIVLDVDPDALETVLSELVTNAREAMPRGGDLTIECGVDPAAALDASGAPAPRGVLSVSDTGAGLNERTLNRIFEPFYTTKHGSLGMGLATVSRLVSRQGGHVQAETRRDGGATFRVMLPLAEALPDETRRPPPASENPLEGRLALVVEDDPTVRELVQDILESKGMRVAAAPTAADALRLAARDREGLDLLLSDLVLPGEGGRALARRVRELRPDLPVLFVSGSGNERLLGSLADEDNAPFLAKPFSPADLLTRVQDLLALTHGRDGNPQRE